MMGQWGAIHPPCAKDPGLMDMTYAKLPQVTEAARACRDCPLRMDCAEQEPVGWKQMQAGVVYNRVKGKDRAYTVEQWIRLNGLLPKTVDPNVRVRAKRPPKKRVWAPRHRPEQTCRYGHPWPADPVRDTAGHRSCQVCKAGECRNKHPRESLSTDKNGKVICRACLSAGGKKGRASQGLTEQPRVLAARARCGSPEGVAQHRKSRTALCVPCRAMAALVGQVAS